MTAFLAILMFVLSLVQKNKSDKIAALIFSVSAVFLSYFTTYNPKFYFLSSALYEGTGIFALLTIVQLQSNQVAQKLKSACMVLVILQSVFYCIWYAEINVLFGFKIHQIYAYTWTVYYSMICAILLSGTLLSGLVIKHFRLCSFDFGGGKFYPRLHKKAAG